MYVWRFTFGLFVESTSVSIISQSKFKGRPLFRKADLLDRPHITKQNIVLWERADEQCHCSESQWHRSSMGYKGSTEHTAASTVWRRLAGTMGKVRLLVFLCTFCASAYLRGLFSRSRWTGSFLLCGIVCTLFLIRSNFIFIFEIPLIDLYR